MGQKGHELGGKMGHKSDDLELFSPFELLSDARIMAPIFVYSRPLRSRRKLGNKLERRRANRRSLTKTMWEMLRCSFLYQTCASNNL